MADIICERPLCYSDFYLNIFEEFYYKKKKNILNKPNKARGCSIKIVFFVNLFILKDLYYYKLTKLPLTKKVKPKLTLTNKFQVLQALKIQTIKKLHSLLIRYGHVNFYIYIYFFLFGIIEFCY